MKRSVPPAGVARRDRARRVVGLHPSLTSAACAPDKSVKPGAPVLTQFYIVAGGADADEDHRRRRPTVRGTAGGAACDPVRRRWPPTPAAPDTLCRDARRQPTGAPAPPTPTTSTMGTWSCAPFVGVTAVIAIFDRLLDTDAARSRRRPGQSLTDIATATAGAGTRRPRADRLRVQRLADGPRHPAASARLFFGNFRTGAPACSRSPARVPVGHDDHDQRSNPAKVRAKDGKTPFTAGRCCRTALKFTTAPFGGHASRRPT